MWVPFPKQAKNLVSKKTKSLNYIKSELNLIEKVCALHRAVVTAYVEAVGAAGFLLVRANLDEIKFPPHSLFDAIFRFKVEIRKSLENAVNFPLNFASSHSQPAIE